MPVKEGFVTILALRQSRHQLKQLALDREQSMHKVLADLIELEMQKSPSHDDTTAHGNTSQPATETPLT